MKQQLTRDQIEKWWLENMPKELTKDELDMIEMYEEDDDLYINVKMDDSRIEQIKSELEDWLGTEVNN